MNKEDFKEINGVLFKEIINALMVLEKAGLNTSSTHMHLTEIVGTDAFDKCEHIQPTGLTENDLSRLSYLSSSLVARPHLWSKFTKQALLQEKSSQQSSFAKVVQELRTRIEAAGGSPTQELKQETLRDVATGLIREKEPEFIAAGRVLAGALESAHKHR